MEQHRIGENAIEAALRQVELKEVLLKDFATGFGTGHLGEALGAIKPDRNVPHCRERLQVTPRPAAKIENLPRRRSFDMAQQRVDVLADVVVTGAFAKVISHAIVVADGGGGDLRKGLWIEFH
ncbi:hypothetical protein A259_09734 [Pseudomonas syringae pv. actinidiae ICMP 19070]|nr:hypothetical protein A259_09734 [Pseudomonas syringae pv. actinidiae ICMP 19070]